MRDEGGGGAGMTRMHTERGKRGAARAGEKHVHEQNTTFGMGGDDMERVPSIWDSVEL